MNYFSFRESKEPKNPMIELFYGDYSEIGNNKGKYNSIIKSFIQDIKIVIYNYKDNCKIVFVKNLNGKTKT